MKNLFILTLFVLQAINLCGQAYSGLIVDQQNEPIAYANIETFDKDSTFIAGSISNDDGTFILESDSKNAYIEISFIGFKTKTIVPEQFDLGTITLENDAYLMDEITITARRQIFQQKVDRLVYNVENTVVGRGGTLIDALNNTPSVNVDSDDLSIIGKGSVKVMINDRLIQLSGKDLMSYLSTIPSDDIKKIEVITAPPAKYDAEGNSGLINIVLKKARPDSWSNQMRLSYINYSFPQFNLGNTFNYNKGKLSLSASITGKKGDYGSIFDGTVEYPNNTWVSHTDFKNQNDNFSSRINVDYNISPKSSIGFLYANSFSGSDVEDEGKTLIEDGQNSYLLSNGYADVNNRNHTANVHYIQQLDTSGRKMSIDIDYFDYVNMFKRDFSSQRFITKQAFFEAENETDQHIKNYSARVDMEHPTQWANFSYGAKMTRTHTSNDVKFYNIDNGQSNLDPRLSNIFDYTEDIRALYIDFTKPISKKWQSKFGLRYENTSTKGISKTNNETNKNNYNKLFPTVFFNYNHNENNIFNFSYNRRIRRPSFQKMNPFRLYLNANSYQVGNPFLKPQITDNIELTHIYKGKFITKAFFSYADDGFIDVTQVDNQTNTQRISIDNFFESKYYGINETIILHPTSWWNATSQISIYKMNAKYKSGYDFGMQLLSGVNMNLFSKNTFALNSSKTINLETTMIYASKQKYINFIIDPTFTFNIGLNTSFMDNKLNCNITVNDIFKTKSSDLRTSTNGIQQTYYNYHDNRNVQLSLTYKFGNQKIRGNARTSGNSDEINRAK